MAQYELMHNNICGNFSPTHT